MRRVAVVAGALCVAAGVSIPVLADAQLTGVDAGGPGGSLGVVVADAGGGDVGGCVESVPKGATKPVLSETFPVRGASGWAATLSVTVRHGKGERVLPAGLDLAGAVEAKKYLQKAGFAIPDQDGGAAAHLWTEPEDKDRSYSVTHLELPLVVLPEKPGRSMMVLPPMPVAVARANGEIATVCTHPHPIGVEDPTANVPQAEPKTNPPPRPQREEWTALKKALLWGGLGLLVGALLAYFGYKHFTKPKPPEPPPPPRPPWEIALERLDEVRHAGLLDAQRHAEYFDRVNDAVRGYLGARFGFEGLESTSDEILSSLKKHAGGFVRIDTASELNAPTPGIPLDEVRQFLAECDLVKFANLRPSPDQCGTALTVGEHIIRSTMPFSAPGATPPKVAAPPPAPAPAEMPSDDSKYAPPAAPSSPGPTAPPDDPGGDA
jgi:hypothetical protein